MTNQKYQNLDNALKKLKQSPVFSQFLTAFNNSANTINEELIQTISKEIPDYLAANSLINQTHLKRHLTNNTQCLLDLINSDISASLAFIEEFNQHNAIGLLSLETNLHLYRVCQKVYSRNFRNSVLSATSNKKILAKAICAVDELMLEYTDAVSTLAARSYVEQTRIIRQAADDKRAQQLTMLLGGFDESDSRASSILGDAGFMDDGQYFCVAVAHAVDPKQMLNYERARRMADSIDKLFASEHGRRLIDVRDNKVIMIFSKLNRLSGWSKPNNGLAKIISKQMTRVGNAAYIGISNDVQKYTHIPVAYKQSLMALKMAKPTERVICAGELSVYETLVNVSGDEIQNAMPQWADDLYKADDKSSGSLSLSLRAYAKTNMNILKAGAVLSIHPNTVYSRFNKIHKLTGLDARRFEALIELLLVCDIRISKHRH